MECCAYLLKLWLYKSFPWLWDFFLNQRGTLKWQKAIRIFPAIFLIKKEGGGIPYFIVRDVLAVLVFATLEEKGTLERICVDLHIFSDCIILTALSLFCWRQYITHGLIFCTYIHLKISKDSQELLTYCKTFSLAYSMQGQDELLWKYSVQIFIRYPHIHRKREICNFKSVF